MNISSYERLVTSLINDIKRNRKITFLFGSAISVSKDGVGVPGVDATIEIIKEYLEEFGMLEDYKEIQEHTSGSKGYQEIFDYLLSVGEQSDLQAIMNRIMDKAKNKDEWQITKTIKDLTKLIKLKLFNISHIFTTNFDPLLEESLKKNDIIVNKIVLDCDSNISSFGSYNNDAVNIIHLHGFYSGDTMHTPNQLLATRTQLKESLKDILSESKLYIIGYGGWDDIFNLTLTEIVNAPKSKYEVRWAFFNENESEIRENNAKLISTLQPAILKGRFNIYKGVDCEVLFEDICNKINRIELFDSARPDHKEGEVRTKIIPLSDLYSPPSKKRNDFYIKPFPNPPDPSHETIRLSEQGDAFDILQKDGSLTLICGWGYGKLGFISSLFSDNLSGYTQLRTDLSTAENKEQIENKIREDVGVDFTMLAAGGIESSRLVIIFDNIIHTNNDVISYLNGIIDIIRDYGGIINGIFIVSKDCNLSNEKIRLKNLDIVDVKEYIRIIPESRNMSVSSLERLCHKSSGLPAKLDLIKNFLEFTSLEHVLEDAHGELDLMPNDSSDSIPKYLLDKISALSRAEKDENARLYELLKILSIIEYGEQARNIMRHYYSYRFTLSDFAILIDMDLIYPIDIEDFQGVKINRVNPLVKDYVISLMDPEELHSQRHNAMSLILGECWKQGRTDLVSTSKMVFNYMDFSPGNAHILLISELKHAMKLSQDTDTILKAMVAYCTLLKDKSRFKEVTAFAQEIINLNIAKNTIDALWINYFLAEGMRMLGQEDVAISILEPIFEDIERNKKLYNKDLYERTMHTLALSYSHSNNEKAYIFAKKLRAESPKKSYGRFLGEKIFTTKLPKEERIIRLKKIEKLARGSGVVNIANNISLELAGLLKDQEMEYVNKVISSEDSIYTKIRAMLIKFDGIIGSNSSISLNAKDRMSLLSAYSYLFMQRLDKLFNRCHEILWQVLENDNDVEQLYKLFMTSALVWRVNGNHSDELKYAKLIQSILELANGNDDTRIKSIQQRCLLIQKPKIPQLAS
ncbi:SIR2 family protein [Aeromonas sp. sif2433]|uniref:SIR2 family protein n=1 Tax=Aeromonas sp. sif2433 TaxID=2854794 RepID=UPI001C48D457|nr:SIR2 family protein [Aeromonas sp. sif2433]MBV7413566.1 SIR2 family protein [Aeromonas sp. sif2433]